MQKSNPSAAVGHVEAFFDAFRYLTRGWWLVRQRGLRRYVLLPLTVNVMVFGAFGWVLITTMGDWMDGIGWLAQWREYRLLALLEQLVRVVLGVIVVLLMAFSFTLFANLIGAPFNGLLAERVSARLCGRDVAHEDSWRELVTGLPRTLGGEIAKWCYLLLWLVPLLLLHLVPLVNVVAPLLLFAFGAWMYALEYLDYPLGNRGMGFTAGRRFLAAHRLQACGFGTAVALASMVPIVNLVVMPVAVAGATALYVERLAPDASSRPAGADAEIRS